MADVTLSYKGSDILELSDSGSATLKTGGKYCEDDIEVEYVKPSGGAYTYSAEENLLDGVSFSNGYIASGGTIQTNAANKEVVSDFVDVAPSETLYACYSIEPESGRQRWIGIGFYDDDSVFKSRLTPISTVDQNAPFGMTTVQVPSNSSKMRVSFRTFGYAEFMLSRTAPTLGTSGLSETASKIIVD